MSALRCFVVLFVLATSTVAVADEVSEAEQSLALASRTNQTAFLLFHRGNDARTQALHRTLANLAANRDDASVVAVAVNDPADQRLIQRFDATRMPLPAIVAVAPNDAVTGVFGQRFTAADFNSAIVSPGYADCVKALQNDRLVLLCIHPEGQNTVPQGVTEFQANNSFGKQVQVVSVSAANPQEAKTLADLGIASDVADVTTVFMAPPGVMVGKFDQSATASALAARLAEAGKCCDDPNCNHGRKKTANRPNRRR